MFYQSITTFGFRIGEAIKRTVAFREFKFMVQIALFLITKGFTVADEKLKIARVRLVHMRIINFVHDAVAQREPKPAACMISGAETVFGAGCPARCDAGCAEGGVI